METTPQQNAPSAPANADARFRRQRPARKKRIGVVTMGVKLGDETRGYTRFRFLCELLVKQGFEVELFTSSFQHWEKAQRDTSCACYRNQPYRITFIQEPGYQKNLDLTRIKSHRIAARNLRALLQERFKEDPHAFDLLYAEIPPNDVARVCAEEASRNGIPFVADINDLWPEAMRMVVNVPVLSDIAFYPFTRDARKVYQLLTAAVGTSDEYALRPAADREKPYPHITVYVGNDLAAFDDGVSQHADAIEKPNDEVWVAYAGTLGASYDLATLVQAGAELQKRRKAQLEKGADRTTPPIRIKILGDGPDRPKLEELARRLGAPVDFLGYQDYPSMAAWLSKSDITVNSLVASAAQSIVTKIGDYLASRSALVNTGSSPEFRNKVVSDGFGVNVEAEQPAALADALEELARNSSLRKIMAAKGRRIAEQQFDQPHSYLAIVDLIQTLS